MPFSVTSTQGRQVLKLEGSVTIRHAQDLAVSLVAGLTDGTPVGVDTAGLEDIDTCILQLLCSLGTTVPALFFDNPSDVFVSATDRCGLRRQLLGSRESL